MIDLNTFKKGFLALSLVSFYSLTPSSSIAMERKLEEKGTPKPNANPLKSNSRKPRPLSLLSPNHEPFEVSGNQPQISNQTSPAKYSSPRIQPSPRHSPRPSPRHSPRPRCSSASNSLGEPPSSSLESLGTTLMRSLTPRLLRLNDYIAERLEEMGKSESEKPIDVCCKKFYQKFKGQENESSLASKYDWQNNTEESPLDQFWNYSVMDCLTADKIQKLDEKSLEAIGSSVIFLIEELKNQSHPEFKSLCSVACNIYRHLSEKISKKLNITPEDVSEEECFYHIAKYSTLMNSFTEAWPLLNRCVELLVWDDEELEWINLLKDGYLNYLKNKEAREANRYEEFFRIADFLQDMKAHTKEVTDNEENPLDTEIVNTCLEGTKDLYGTNLSSGQKLERIKKLNPDVLLPLAGATYRNAQGENEENAKTLLTISLNCFSLLSQDILENSSNLIIDEILESLCQDDPRSVKLLKAEIFTHIGKVAWSVNEKEKATELFFEAAKVFHYTKPQMSYSSWNPEALALILGKTLQSAPQDIWEIMVHNLCLELVNAQHVSSRP
jgi:hypothetical protein